MTATFTRAAPVRSLRTRLLMERQQKAEIGERIRELRDNSAETNRSISDAVGVGERSVAGWIAGDGIAYENAQKVAELFQVDVDYIWRGRSRGATPDVMAALSPDGEALAHLVKTVAALAATLAEMEGKLDVALDALHEKAPQKPARGSAAS